MKTTKDFLDGLNINKETLFSFLLELQGLNKEKQGIKDFETQEKNIDNSIKNYQAKIEEFQKIIISLQDSKEGIKQKKEILRQKIQTEENNISVPSDLFMEETQVVDFLSQNNLNTEDIIDDTPTTNESGILSAKESHTKEQLTEQEDIVDYDFSLPEEDEEEEKTIDTLSVPEINELKEEKKTIEPESIIENENKVPSKKEKDETPIEVNTQTNEEEYNFSLPEEDKGEEKKGIDEFKKKESISPPMLKKKTSAKTESSERGSALSRFKETEVPKKTRKAEDPLNKMIEKISLDTNF